MPERDMDRCLEEEDMEKEEEGKMCEERSRKSNKKKTKDIFETDFNDLQSMRKEQKLTFKEVDTTKEYAEM